MTTAFLVNIPDSLDSLTTFPVDIPDSLDSLSAGQDHDEEVSVSQSGKPCAVVRPCTDQFVPASWHSVVEERFRRLNQLVYYLVDSQSRLRTRNDKRTEDQARRGTLEGFRRLL